eukprot:scaffold28789_cov118-Isochrysis_galbana.AAC.2
MAGPNKVGRLTRVCQGRAEGRGKGTGVCWVPPQGHAARSAPTGTRARAAPPPWRRSPPPSGPSPPSHWSAVPRALLPFPQPARETAGRWSVCRRATMHLPTQDAGGRMRHEAEAAAGRRGARRVWRACSSRRAFAAYSAPCWNASCSCSSSSPRVAVTSCDEAADDSPAR